jgi:hypothetical protein
VTRNALGEVPLEANLSFTPLFVQRQGDSRLQHLTVQTPLRNSHLN